MKTLERYLAILVPLAGVVSLIIGDPFLTGIGLILCMITAFGASFFTYISNRDESNKNV